MQSQDKNFDDLDGIVDAGDDALKMQKEIELSNINQTRASKNYDELISAKVKENYEKYQK